MVPVGLFGEAITSPASGPCTRSASSSSSGVGWKRTCGPASISTTWHPSACRMFRYAGYPGRAIATRSPGLNAARNPVTNAPDDPVVTATCPACTSSPYHRR